MSFRKESQRLPGQHLVRSAKLIQDVDVDTEEAARLQVAKGLMP